MKAYLILESPHSYWSIFVIFICLLWIIHYYSLRRIFNQRKKNNLIDSVNENAIYTERKRISLEMHDEIGPNLSALKLYCELALKNGNSADEIKQISLMVNELSEKIVEVTWNLNLEGDTLENLIDFIYEQSRKLFAYSDISLKVTFPKVIPTVQINNQSKRDIYLLIKELIHNSLKHSKAKQVLLAISIYKGAIVFLIKDNGVGFNPNIIKSNSTGLNNAKERVKQLKASIMLDNSNGTMITVKIPLISLSNEENIIN
ncbi:sensor histidine kinase [Pedobacter sp. Leaf170]|uniref:sensor histidine kinase n=1 Tax=Pedobacter sp. Leaf170 TaxID=2876558 RepID=UPI001E508E95|nr:ATP-binding protein [Pedobacter sp. Leaf170]